MVGHGGNERTWENHFSYLSESMKLFAADTGFPQEVVEEIFIDYLRFVFAVFTEFAVLSAIHDYEKLCAFAHQLKGSSGNLRIQRMYDLAFRLEQAGQERREPVCLHILAEIGRELAYYDGDKATGTEMAGGTADEKYHTYCG